MDVSGEQDVSLATERHKLAIDGKGLQQRLCAVSLRPENTKNLSGMVMLVVGICLWMVGLGMWPLEGGPWCSTWWERCGVWLALGSAFVAVE